MTLTCLRTREGTLWEKILFWDFARTLSHRDYSECVSACICVCVCVVPEKLGRAVCEKGTIGSFVLGPEPDSRQRVKRRREEMGSLLHLLCVCLHLS